MESPTDPIQVTNILGSYRETQTKPRTIMTHFGKLQDKDRIRKAAKCLADKPYKINDQFPPETAERIKKLYPIVKFASRNNKNVFFRKVVRLYIERK